MRNSKPMLTLAAIFAVCGLFLASCGGGSGSGSSATTINGISVPPEPDATQNNATVAGVDSNSNGVRDDVERKIAEKTNATENQDFTGAVAAAKVYQEIVTTNNWSADTAKQVAKRLICSSKSNYFTQESSAYKGDSISDMVANTDDRKNNLKQYTALTSGIDYADFVGADGEIHCE